MRLPLFRYMFAPLILVIFISIETGCGAFVAASSRPARIHDSRTSIVPPVHQLVTTRRRSSLTLLHSWKQHHHQQQQQQQLEPFEGQRDQQYQKQLDLVLSTRGGGSDKPEPQITKDNNTQKWKKQVRFTITTCAVLVVTWYGWMYRAELMRIFNKDQLQTKTLQLLSKLDDLPKHKSYTIYTLGMACWELLGLSTIPVETAAGMVFGWNGFFLSGMGKLLGAMGAFVLGRHSFLASFVQSKLKSNTFLQLVEEQTESHPLRVLLYLKCSCFPETIKNFGAAVLFPIRLWMFTLGTMMHGWTFTALWTFLGVDTARHLVNPNLPVNGLLNTLIILSIINGVVISPLAMGLWIKGLRETNESHQTS